MHPSLIIIAIMVFQASTHNPNETSSLAANLVRAMQIYDSSIRSMEWTQVAVQEVQPANGIKQESAQAFDEKGHWFYDCRATSTTGDEHVPLSIDHVQRVSDGTVVYGVDLSSKTGTIRGYSADRQRSMGIDCWLGRQLEAAGQKRLCEYLLEAPDLRLVSTLTRERPQVAATVTIDNVIYSLEVEIDAEHDFCPRTIQLRGAALRIPYWTYEIIDYTC